MNSLVDPAIIDKLYEASAAGVPIDLVVRGICCLRPGVPGLSRKHLRQVDRRPLPRACAGMWCFANGARAAARRDASVYISSADWMPRNFDRRIEYMLPIENPTVHAQLLDQVMVANLHRQRAELAAAIRTAPTRGSSRSRQAFNLHDYFMTNPSLSGRGAGAEEGPQGAEAALPARTLSLSACEPGPDRRSSTSGRTRSGSSSMPGRRASRRRSSTKRCWPGSAQGSARPDGCPKTREARRSPRSRASGCCRPYGGASTPTSLRPPRCATPRTGRSS